MQYFQHEKLSARIIRIVGLDRTCCYLVNGDQKTALLDTGSGYGNLKDYIMENHLAAHEDIMVLLTHGHHDHMGGADSFDNIYMNAKDRVIFDEFGRMEVRKQYALEMTKQYPMAYQSMIATTKKKLHDIADNQVFDLGHLHIQMIPVAGHTPGMMCPLIIEERTIIFGDACGVSVLLMDQYSSTVSEYKKSLLYLQQFEEQYDRVYRNHGTFFSQKSLLKNVIECCDLILKQQDAHMPVTLHQRHFFSAQPVDGYGRIDGQEGNIFYIEEKAR